MQPMRRLERELDFAFGGGFSRRLAGLHHRVLDRPVIAEDANDERAGRLGVEVGGDEEAGEGQEQDHRK